MRRIRARPPRSANSDPLGTSSIKVARPFVGWILTPRQKHMAIDQRLFAYATVHLQPIQQYSILDAVRLTQTFWQGRRLWESGDMAERLCG